MSAGTKFADVEEAWLWTMRCLMARRHTKSWAWNATYHRREIREAQKKIEYHTSKLNVAALRAKAALNDGAA